MGVDHGGGETGGTSPTKFRAGTLIQIVPSPQILSYRYKNERSVAFKIRQNPFAAGAGEGTPLPICHPTRHGPTFGARRASPPQKSSQIYAYECWWIKTQNVSKSQPNHEYLIQYLPKYVYQGLTVLRCRTITSITFFMQTEYNVQVVLC